MSDQRRRADLQAALYELVRERSDIRFGTQVEEVAATTSGVEVRLSDGSIERADLLVGADGIHSNVRSLVFGKDSERPLGGVTSRSRRYSAMVCLPSFIPI